MATAVTVVEQLYDRWRAGDLRALAGEVDPGVELVADPLVPSAVLHGRDGWEQWAGRWEERFAELEIRSDALIPMDDTHVLALVSMRAQPAGGGAPLQWAAAHVWTVRDGRVARWQAHTDLDAARATLDA